MTRRKKVVFAAITLALLAALVETGFRVAALVTGFLPTADESLNNEWRWARAHIEAGKPSFESEMTFDPLLGWKLRADYRSDALRTNSAGMRADREFAVERAPGSRRLLFVGDSYTHGHGVRDAEAFPSILSRGALRDWEVLNLAVPGYGTDQQVLMLEEVGARYRPDIVILGFFVRDFSRNTIWFRDYAKPLFVPAEGGADALELTHVPVPSPEELFEDYRSGRRSIGRPFSSYALAWAGRALHDAWKRMPAERSPEWNVLRRLMSRFQRSAKAAGAFPIWLVIPNGDALREGRSRYGEIEDLVEARARAQDLVCHRLDAPFREWTKAHSDRPIYRPADQGGHLSVTGNEVVAREIEVLLGRLGLLASHAPPHADLVRIDGGSRPFLIGRHEVTNGEYAAFVRATGYDGSEDPSSKATERFLGHFVDGAPPAGKERHPVCLVNLTHARAYCRWLSKATGGRVRLPTDAEWDLAARGREGRVYPWGDVWDPKKCNWGDAAGTGRFGAVDGFEESAPVGSFPAGATPEGVFDLAGNVWEWTEDGSLRGGPWCLDPEAMRSAVRGREDIHRADDKFGFRIVVEVGPDERR